jgi:hypothetical protein
LISDSQVAFGPAELRAGNDETAQVEGHYALDNRSVGLKVSSRQLTIAEIESGATRLLDANPIPVLERMHKGTFNGWVAFERRDDQAAKWTGEYDVQNATLDVPGLAAPLRLSSASVTMREEQIQIAHLRGRAGNVRVEADYRFDLAGTRAHSLRLVVPEAQLADLERLLMPALRRQEGFLARAFRLRAQTVPPWLKERDLEGSVQVNNLLYGDAPLGSFRARLKWNGAHIQLTDAECRREDMRASGDLSISLSGSLPQYHLSGRIENMDYRGGQLDLEGDMDTGGIGSDLLLNARGDGEFEGRDIDLGPEADGLNITGAYHLGTTVSLPRLLLHDVELTQGSDTLVGQGASQADGHIVFELTSGRKQVRVTGMLLPVRPEPAVAR